MFPPVYEVATIIAVTNCPASLLPLTRSLVLSPHALPLPPPSSPAETFPMRYASPLHPPACPHPWPPAGHGMILVHMLPAVMAFQLCRSPPLLAILMPGPSLTYSHTYCSPPHCHPRHVRTLPAVMASTPMSRATSTTGPAIMSSSMPTSRPTPRTSFTWGLPAVTLRRPGRGNVGGGGAAPVSGGGRGVHEVCMIMLSLLLLPCTGLAGLGKGM